MTRQVAGLFEPNELLECAAQLSGPSIKMVVGDCLERTTPQQVHLLEGLFARDEFGTQATQYLLERVIETLDGQQEERESLQQLGVSLFK